jgi:hypothetical protein
MKPNKGTSYLRFKPEAGAVKKLNLPEKTSAFRVVLGGAIDGFFLVDEETSTGDIGVPCADGDWILNHGRPVAFDGRNLSAAGSGIGELVLELYSGETVALTPGAPGWDHATVRFMRSETDVAFPTGTANAVTLFSVNDNELHARYRQLDIRRTSGLYLSGVIHSPVAFTLELVAEFNGKVVVVASQTSQANLGSSGGQQMLLERGLTLSATALDRRVNLPCVPTRVRVSQVTAGASTLSYQLGLLSR